MVSVLRLLAGTFTGGYFWDSSGQHNVDRKSLIGQNDSSAPFSRMAGCRKLASVLAGLGARPWLRPFVMPANGFQNWDYPPTGATGDAVAFSITTTPTLKVARHCLALRGLACVRAHWRVHSSTSEWVGGTVGGCSCACAQLWY
jgi:hypothetical protein